MTAYRPADTGIGLVAGWGCFAGGYGAGSVEYASLDMIVAQVTDTDIYSAVTEVLPAATIGWTQIVD